MSPKSHDRNLRNKTLAVIAGTVVVVAGGIAGSRVITDGGGGGDATTANYWIDTNGGTCVRSSTPATYQNNGTECDTMNEAYQATNTACGDTVNIASGSYPEQQLIERSALSGCSSDVVFRTGANQTVDFDGVHFGSSCCGAGGTDGADHITIKGPMAMLGGVACVSDCLNITIDDIDGGTIGLETFDGAVPEGGPAGPRFWTIKNSDLGPCMSSDITPAGLCEAFISSGAGPQIVLVHVSDITFENNDIHNFELINDPPDHFESMRTGDVQNMTVRGNRFWNCEIYCLSTTDWRGTNYIENNWFGGSDSSSDSAIGEAITADPTIPGEIYVRGNSFSMEDGITSDAGNNHTGWHIIGNIIGTSGFLGHQCFTNAEYKYNIYRNATPCGDATNVGGATFSNFYVNAGRNLSMEYHLTGTNDTPDNFVPSSAGCPATDIDGQARPQNTNCDAGADERNQ